MAWMRLEGAAYWTLFVATFLAIAIWESFQPRSRLSVPAEQRWGRHGILLAISGVLMTAVLRASPVLVAAGAAGSRYGLLNQPWLPFPLRSVLAVLLLDLALYASHRTFHSFYWLWRVHEVHHSDVDYDVSTAARFHPLEVILVRGFYLGVVALAAAPPEAAFAAELLMVVLNLFAHANASLPAWCERPLRTVFITPDLHRIHHSEDAAEQTRNFGQTFSIWDRLFGTYAAGIQVEATGVKGVPGGRPRVGMLLAAPFQRRTESQTDPAA